jgi:hypothetical protein
MNLRNRKWLIAALVFGLGTGAARSSAVAMPRRRDGDEPRFEGTSV